MTGRVGVSRQSPNMLLGGFIVDGLDGIEGLGIEELRVEVTPLLSVGIERWIWILLRRKLSH